MRKQTKQLKTITTWALLALLAILWLQFILFPVDSLQDMQAASAPPTELLTDSQRPKPSSYHLFGSSAVSEIPLNLMQSETSLDLIITGILSSNDPTQGRAYIKNNRGDEKKFKVGDDVFGLAKLSAIHEDHLILNRNGRSEKLSLSKGHLLNTNKQSTKPAVNPNDSKAAAANRIASHIKTADDWQATLNQQKFNPNKIAQMAGKVSVVQDSQGRIAGLKVADLAGQSNLVKQGLRANDQIVSVNGVDISYQNIMTLQKQLESNDQVSVTVMRNGRKMNLNLNLSEFK